MVFKTLLDKLSPARRIVLELDLARGVLETFPRNPLQMLQVVGATAVSDLREHLKAATGDERVAGLIVHAVNCNQPMTVMDEIAHLIEDFGTAKPTMAWAESFGEFGNSLAAYKLATACRTIWLQPTGVLGIGGLEVDITLFRGLLEKAGLLQNLTKDATVLSLTAEQNPRGFKFEENQPEVIVQLLDDSAIDLAFINSNFILSAGLNTSGALLVEEVEDTQ